MKDMKTTRPRSLSGTTTVLETAHGNLYLTVSVDDTGKPFEVFGQLGKAGTFERGVAEMACRLVSLHLQRGTPISEIVEQLAGIHEMHPGRTSCQTAQAAGYTASPMPSHTSCGHTRQAGTTAQPTAPHEPNAPIPIGEMR